MLDHDLIRRNVLLVAEPGLFTEQAIRAIISEAQRYAEEWALKAAGISQANVMMSPEAIHLVRDARGLLIAVLREHHA
jgi:hypothetical protein